MYKLTSVKGGRAVAGTKMQAIDAAIAMEEELQPVLGITIETEDGEIIAKVQDGAIDGRTADTWWSWHDADSSRWSPSTDEAEAKCADWMVSGEDGPADDE